jgi:hypothetical protein
LGTGFEAIEPRLLMSRDAALADDVSGPLLGPSSGFVDIGSLEAGPFLGSLSGSGSGAIAPASTLAVPASTLIPISPSPSISTPSTNVDPGSPPIRQSFSPEPLDTGGDDAAEELDVGPAQSPDRVPPPLPDSPGKEGGAIDISPRSGARDEDVIPLRQQTVRASTIATSEKQSWSSDLSASRPLQAARGEAQAFELAYAAWQNPARGLQRIAPPKPGEAALPAADVASATAQEGDTALAIAASAVAVDAAPSSSRGSLAPLAATLDPLELDKLAAALPTLGEETPAELDGQQSGTDPSQSHPANRLSSGGPLVAEIIATPSGGDFLPGADSETAARVVGAGLVVMAWHVGVLYAYPERPSVQRTPTRDWERGLEMALAQLPPRP